MKILFITLGSQGDVSPFLHLALELKARGHEAVLLATEPYRSLVTNAGVAFESIQTEDRFHALAADKNIWKPVIGPATYLKANGEASEKIFEVVERHADQSPPLLVCNHSLPGGFFAARKLKLRIVSVFLQPYSIPSAVTMAKESPLINALLDRIGTSGRRFVIRSVQKVLERSAGENDFLSVGRFDADLLLGLWPDWFCPPKADWTRELATSGFVGSNGVSEDSKTLAQIDVTFLESSPLVFTMGSEMIQDFARQADLFADVCAKLGRKGIFVTPAMRGQPPRVHRELCL